MKGPTMKNLKHIKKVKPLKASKPLEERPSANECVPMK